MHKAHRAIAVRGVAAIAAAATTSLLLPAVVTLSEPQRSQLMAATNGRQMTSRPHRELMAQSTSARPAAGASASAQ